MAATTYELSAVKNPFGDGFLGMAVGKHFDGTPMTLYSVNEDGNMEVFDSAAEALASMDGIMFGLMSFRFKPFTEITPESLGKAAKDFREEEREDEA